MDPAPNKYTWKQFCSEPPLTPHEQDQLKEMGAWVRANDAAFEYLLLATEAERLAEQDIPPTTDWSDMVAWATAVRLRRRAEIRAWQAWTSQETLALTLGHQTPCFEAATSGRTVRQ